MENTELITVLANSNEKMEKGENVMTNNESNTMTWNRAEELRKNGHYEEALPFFLKHFNEKNSSESLWRAVHCARKMKDYELASDLMRENFEHFSRAIMLRTQLGWLKYDTTLQEYKKRNNSHGIIKVCDEILELNYEKGNSLFCKTLFAAIDAAKALNDGEKLIELTDMIEPDKLSDEKAESNGKKIMSYRERWYFARLHALYESKLYEECRELAFTANRLYRGRLEFLRRAALCLIKLGSKKEAEKELTKITSSRGCPWYILSDLAELRFELGEYEKALEPAFTAATMFGELKTKVNLFSLIARIQLVLGESDSAYNHGLLAYAIRHSEGWKYGEECQKLNDRFGFDGNIPTPKSCLKKCTDEWKAKGYDGSSKKNSNKTNKETVKKSNGLFMAEAQGVLMAYQSDRNFAFIKSSLLKEKVYVKVADIPESLRQNGATLIFDIYESFDYVKNKNGYKAANIRDNKNQEALAA